MLLTTYRNRNRPLGFALSTLVHAGLFYVVVAGSSEAVLRSRFTIRRNYSVLVLRLDDYRPLVTPRSSHAQSGSTGAEGAGKSAPLRVLRRPSQDAGGPDSQ